MKYVKILAAILVLLLAAGASYGLYTFRPVTKKGKSASRPIPIVRTIDLSPKRRAVFVEAYGTVIPAAKTVISSEVEGRIVEQSDRLVPGGIMTKNGLIVRIDPANYAFLVKERQAEVEEAKYALALEEGQQTIAREEWRMMEKDIRTDEAGKSLILREPHLKRVRSRLEAAESRLASAELDVSRTVLRAPFNALVLEEFVEKGQFIGKQTAIATLVESDRFWVQVAVPLKHLSRISLPDDKGGKGAAVRIVLDMEGSAPVTRNGRVYKLLGELDPEGRMARLLVAIDDPLNLKGEKSRGKILLGSYVKAEIEAGVLEDVYAMPRQALYEGNRIWLTDGDNRLKMRDVTVLWRLQEEFLIAATLAPGEKLVLSRLQSPLPGMTVRPEEQGASGEGEKR